MPAVWDSHALHRHFERSEKFFSFASKRCICGERKTGNPSSRNLRAKPAIMTQSLVKLRPTPSFRAKREIFFICGKTVYMRRTKNGKPVGTPRAKPAIMTLSLMKPLCHRHFEQSEKSFSFAIKRCICEERKTGNLLSENLGNLCAIPTIMTRRTRSRPFQKIWEKAVDTKKAVW